VEVILDTNAISALAEGNAAIGRQLEASEEIFVSVISAGEYLCGVRRSKFRGVLEAWLEKFLRKAVLMSLEAQVLPEYAAICQELKDAGTPIPTNDVWIAAQARLHGLKILSRDRHFDRVQGVERMEW
jgi:tRNA(fMet)-specific endonuclease VapC